VYIPINDGKFEYVLNCEYEEQYDLVFEDEYEQGSWKNVSFFSEQGVINFTLYPSDRFNENRIEGGKLTREYWDYLGAVLKIYEPIQKEIDEAQSKHMNIEGELLVRLKQAGEERILLTLHYIKEHSTIVGYSILFLETESLIQRNRFSQETNDVTPYANLYMTVFAPKFPDHPYTERMENLLAGSSIKVGVPFVDFITNDLKGKPVKLSERIKGKPAVLHLWASWCGPCRKKGKELIPVYEEFRDKGFVVIGVAREKSVSSAEAAIKLDKYPWENLVELNDTEKIWVKYGIGNSGGMVFLIDENGIIVANNPSTEEIREFLINKL